MSAATRALLRLYAVQGSWSYDRMLGVGMGFAAEPLLEDLRTQGEGRHAAALGRASEFFNSHPYLAPVALGATVRAEYDGLPPEQIQRLRAALCSPLGALGDQLFWAGVVPMFAAIAIVLAVAGWPWAGVAAVVGGVNAARLATARWGLRTGLAHGMRVGNAIHGGWLPRAVARVGPAAGLSVGLGIGAAAGWFLRGGSSGHGLIVAGVAAVGVAACRVLSPRLTSLGFTLAALAAGLLWRWGTAA